MIVRWTTLTHCSTRIGTTTTDVARTKKAAQPGAAFSAYLMQPLALQGIAGRGANDHMPMAGSVNYPKVAVAP